MALHKNGDKADAQKEFDSLFQSEPNDLSLLLAQVRLLKDDQLWYQLSRKVAEWYQKHPKDSRTLIDIARNLVTSGGSEARETTEDIFGMILKNEPDSTEAMTGLAILLYTVGRPDEAVLLYQRVLEFEPDNLIVINKAVEDFTTCIKLYPNETPASVASRFHLARAFAGLGQRDKAVEYLNQVLELL